MGMPQPGTKDAPKFDENKPSELVRFIDRMEDLFKLHSVTVAQDKIDTLGKYTSAETESEWRALETFTGGDWDKFKEEIIQSYPEASSLSRGSLARLKKICKEKGGRNAITRTDLTELLSLRRAFTAEAEKLLKPPALLSNSELVQAFVDCLSDDFARRLADKLDSLDDAKKLSNATAAQGGPALPVRKEDRFTWKEVMTAAVRIAESASQPFNRCVTWSDDQSGGSSSAREVKLEEEVARLTDSWKISDQRNQAIERQLQQQNLKMEQLLGAVKARENSEGANSNYRPAPQFQPRAQIAQAYPGAYSRPNAYNNAGSFGNRGNLPDQGCYYCKETGHRISDCHWALQHMDLGWIKRVENRLRLADGSPLPNDAVKSCRELVEAFYKIKPGLIPMNKVNLQAVGDNEEYEAYQQSMMDPRVTQLIHGLSQIMGRGALEELMEPANSPRGPLEGLIEDDEVRGNF
jgi:hypothetical protein